MMKWGFEPITSQIAELFVVNKEGYLTQRCDLIPLSIVRCKDFAPSI